MIYLGIDVGLLGALGVVDDRQRAQVFDVPIIVTGTQRKRGAKIKPKREYDIVEIKKLLLRFAGHAIAVIEKTGARPDQGVVSMETFGYGRGLWEMGLLCFDIPLTRVTPVKWKNAMLEGVGHEKEGSILRATQLFPQIDLKGPHGGDRDGRAEALLLAEYARRQRLKGEM